MCSVRAPEQADVDGLTGAVIGPHRTVRAEALRPAGTSCGTLMSGNTGMEQIRTDYRESHC